MTATAFHPPDVLQPVLTGLRERFADAVREVSGHRGEARNTSMPKRARS